MSITPPSMYAGTLPPGTHPQRPVGPQQGGPPGGWVPPMTPPTPAAPAPKKPRRRGWLAMAAVAVVTGVAASGTTIAVMDSSGAAPTVGTTVTRVIQGDSANPDWTATAATASASVVSIEVDGTQGQAQGSGVVLDTSGRVVTNHHVVSGLANSRIAVTLSDRRRYEARVVATDPSTDLAVLQLVSPPSDLVPIKFADVSGLRVGQPVMALGNPLGLSETVTTGIISALDRPVVTVQESGGGPFAQSANGTNQVVTNAIQTNAAINPGNSGGALVNANGELIGITSSIATLGGGRSQSGNLGIGFAIPADQVKAVTDQLIADGRATHAYLGVSTADQNATVNGAGYVGAGVRSVAPGTPAASAGLQSGDVIIGVDNDPVTGSEGLIAQIRDRQSGAKVTLRVVRNGSEVSVPVTLAAAPE